MNLVAQSPRALAVLLTALMVAPIFPVGAAQQPLSQTVPDLPKLGHARPGDECVRLGDIQQDALEAANALASGDTTYFAFDRDVPALCGLNNQPLDQWGLVVREADRILDQYRNVSTELQRQADSRLDYTFPEGPCQRNDNLTRPGDDPTAPYNSTGGRVDNGHACGVVRPSFVLLQDRFDGRRIGGFGEWTVVTERGEEPAWRLDSEITFNGTETRWRLGDDKGYPRGVHQWLVSPELDLTPVRGNKTLVEQLTAAYITARMQMRLICQPGASIVAQMLGTVTEPTCYPGAPGDQLLVAAYERALDAWTEGLPLSREAAYLEITFRANFADGLDGVRPWLFLGDADTEAPGRTTLFSEDFKHGLVEIKDCPATNAQQGNTLGTPCFVYPNGGAQVLGDLPHLKETNAFRDGDEVASPDRFDAWTGDLPSFVTVRMNLTDFIGKRAWLLLEARTLPDSGRGDDMFTDPSLFKRREDFGFEMALAYAQADGYPRNLRIKDVARTYAPIPPVNPWGDSPLDLRTTVPPGNDPIVARIHNAGEHVENATVRVTIEERNYTGDTAVSGFHAFAPPVDVRVTQLRQGEARDVKIPWPRPITEGNVYRVSAEILLDQTTLPPLTNTSAYVEPNATAVRSPNAASSDVGGDTTASSLVRAFTSHRLVAERVSKLPGSAPLEVCASVTSAGCVPLTAAEKGERRILLVGMKNEGNIIENARAYLDLTLDGVDKSSAILDGAERSVPNLVPGETRALQWSLAPADAGIYTALVSYYSGDTLLDTVTRLVFVQRSTGLICFDNMADARECSPAFEVSRPETLLGQDITALLLAEDGTAYAASAVTNTTGALYTRPEGGSWTLLANLSSDNLSATLGVVREDLGYGSIRGLSVGPDGTLYLAGDNGTLLSRSPNGTLLRMPFAQTLTGGLVSLPGNSIVTAAGISTPLTGGGAGGVEPYAVAWDVRKVPKDGVVTIEDSAAGFTNFTASKPGDYVLLLNVTDASGTLATAELAVEVKAQQPACIERPGLIAVDDMPESVEGALDVQCATVVVSAPATSDVAPSVTVDLRIHLASAVATQPVRYYYNLTGNTPATAVFDYDPVSGALTPQTMEPAATLSIDGSTILVSYGSGSFPTATMTDATSLLRIETAHIEAERVSDLMTGDSSFTFRTDDESPGPVFGLEASPGRGDGNAIRLTWLPASDTGGSGVARYVVRRQTLPAGDWVTLAGIVTSPTYLDARLVRGHEYNYSVQALDGRNNLGPRSGAVDGVALSPFPEYADAQWWNGTLWLAGTDGFLWKLNLTSNSTQRVQLVTAAGTEYEHDLRDLLVVDNTLYAAGEMGYVFYNSGAGWRMSVSNSTASPEDDQPADRVSRGHLSSLAHVKGRVYVVGDDGAVLVSSNPRWFEPLEAPLCAAGDCDFKLAIPTHTDDLYILDGASRFVGCDPCRPDNEGWFYPTVPVPVLTGEEGSRAVSLRAAGVTAAETLVLGEAGVVLDFSRRSIYDNGGDWSTIPDLAPKHGGLLVTERKEIATYRLVPNDSEDENLTDWVELRVRLNHYAANVTMAPIAGAAGIAGRAGQMPQVRVWATSFPTVSTRNFGTTCERGTIEDPAAPTDANRLWYTCNSSAWLYTYNVSDNTSGAGWEPLVLDVPVPHVKAGGTTAPLRPSFHSIEFRTEGMILWAIDDVLVEANHGTVEAPDWRPVLSWYAKNHKDNLGKPAIQSLACPTPDRDAPECEEEQSDPLSVPDPWTDSGTTLYHITQRSPWHISGLADRPVWVVNDEVYGNVDPKPTGGARAHLQNHWDTRLVSPIIDLAEAEDPVIEFRHAYAFRARYQETPTSRDLVYDAAGWIEVQYEKRGAECGSDDPTVTCWSKFFKVQPVKGEANGQPVHGYPGLADSFFPNENVRIDYSHVGSDANPFAYIMGPHGANNAHSYWGRNILPDANGVFSAAWDTANYEKVTVLLDAQKDERGMPLDVSGRKIRVGFHVWTGGFLHHAGDVATFGPGSFAGEGWYITDFKVKGAPRLGIDLVADDLEFRVGYDVPRIGLGPGTRLPINVTVSNHGIFDAAGYTGELEIRRVVDQDKGTTERVGILALPQQPVLESGASVNHTLFWDVPAREDEQYTFRFQVTPLGIPVDEDITDNVVARGSVAKPILAKSHPEFHVEFFVTPENATTDITRYVPIFINNTGNVPLADFEVGRAITVLKGALTTKVENVTWHTTGVVKEGTREGLNRIGVGNHRVARCDAASCKVDQQGFNPAIDLWWKAPERSNFLFEVGATAPGLDPSAADRRIAAFATYFFDDVDGGPRGESTSGAWNFTDPWREDEPGFRSALGYSFGDGGIPRYPDDADSSATSPTIDLSSARSARFGLYTRYAFPDAYDAAVVEASSDGGKTWHRLTPRKVVDENGVTSPGYGVTPIPASSPLHLTGDPRNATLAWTGASALLPGASDGWVYREFDLTQFPDITEQDLPYEEYTATELARFIGTGVKDTPLSSPHPSGAPNVYVDSSWHVGPVDEYRYWEVRNETEGTVRSPVGDATVWWSGSANLHDDGKRPVQNQFLKIPFLAAVYEVLRDEDGRIVLDADRLPILVDSTGNPAYEYEGHHLMRDEETGAPIPVLDNGVARVPKAKVDAEDAIIVEWWEWSQRAAHAMSIQGIVANDLRTSWSWDMGASKNVHHQNFTVPVVLETRNNWLRMRADVTAYNPFTGSPVDDLVLAYSVAETDNPSQRAGLGVFDDRHYVDRYLEDRGLAVSGFTIRAVKTIGGQEIDNRILLDAGDAWHASTIEVCAGPTIPVYAGDDPPCRVATPPSMLPRKPFVAPVPLQQQVDIGDGQQITVRVTSSVAERGSPVSLHDETVDFVASGVQPGDRAVAILEGGSAILTILEVAPHDLVLASDPLSRFVVDGEPYRIERAAGHAGAGWGLVSALPPLPAPWSVVDIRDADEKTRRDPLLTGEVPKAWFSGSLCHNGIDRLFPERSGSASTITRTYLESYPGQTFHEQGVRAGDVLVLQLTDGNYQAYSTTIRQVDDLKLWFDELPADHMSTQYGIIAQSPDCMTPGSEARLVTPAIDLSRVAGEEAQLEFWHRYAFSLRRDGDAQDPTASGGVVELQWFDTQTQTWSSWSQLYGHLPSLTSPDGLGPRASLTKALDGQALGIRGGYSAYTVRTSRGVTGQTIHNDLPIESIPRVRSDGSIGAYQFLYSGVSTDVTGDPNDGWVPAEFDLTPWLGKKVRLAFHVALTDMMLQNTTSYQIADPAIHPQTGTYRQSGWWITNISVVGSVLHGAPVQLRLRAATDGNVHDGSWQVDDMGLFGSRYGRNIGIFVDPAPGAFGALQNRTVVVPVTLRNLGETVRRDLAIEAKPLGKDLQLTLSAAPGQAHDLLNDGEILILRGFNLAPGQSIVVPVHVRVQDFLSDVRLDGKIQLTVKEYNSAEATFTDIQDNEVQGFLKRTITIRAEKLPDVRLLSAATSPALPLVGGLVNATVELQNDGYAEVNASLLCRARILGGHRNVDHLDDKFDDVSGADTPCALVEGPSVVPARSAATLVFQATPNAMGLLEFRINGTIQVGATRGEIPVSSITAAIARTPVVFFDNMTPDPLPPGALPDQFPTGRSTEANWTGTGTDLKGQPAKFVWPTGRAEPGALLLGITDQEFQNDGTYSSESGCGTDSRRCVATSKPVDLHNFTTEKLSLSFWHMDRFARHDGGQVLAQVLLNEQKPHEPNSWSHPCVLIPRGGYEGGIKQIQPQSSGASDLNGYGVPQGIPDLSLTQPLFFVTPGGAENAPEESFSRAEIDLTAHTCQEDRDPRLTEDHPIALVGHTVRFLFVAYAGEPSASLDRGRGQGWFIDDVTVSPMSLAVGPAIQAQTLLDNTTKTFNIVIQNTGSYPDVVAFRYDPGNSSAPDSSVSPPAAVELAPGERKIVQALVTLPRDPSLLPTNFRARIVAESTIDRSASYPTDLDLRFEPRPWPELSLQVSIPRTVVQEGTETFLPITVENTGLVESVATEITIVDTWAGGSETTTLELPPIPSYFQKAEDSTRVLEFRWRPAKGSVGAHTLTITADPLKRGEEYSRINNVQVIEMPVSELLIPDLDVSAPDALHLRNSVGATVTGLKEADVTRYEITAGELATLEVKVRNLGKAGATNVDVRAFIGALSLPPKNVPFIPPGGEVALAFNWLAQKGDYEIEVVVRNEQVEVRADNNRNPAQGVTMLVVKGYEISTVLGILPTDIVPPADLRVPFNITNSGNSGEEIRLETLAPAGWTVTLPRTELFLRAGETYSAVATVVVPDDAVAGEQFITIGAVARENPMKVASGSAPAHVHAFYGGSVVAQTVQAAPPLMTVPIKLRNEGNSLDPWQVSVNLPAGWVSQEPLPARIVVPAHGETELVLHLRAPETASPGERALAVRATLPDGSRREGTVTVDVQPLRTASIRLAEDRPRETQGALEYAVTVENAGNVESPFTMLVLDSPDGIDARLEPSTFTLPPGGKTLARLVVTPAAGVDAGAYELRGYTLFEGVRPDTAEGRSNVQHLQVTLIRPDLRVAPLEYAPRTDIETGDRVVVKVTVTNRGQGVVTDVPVHLFVDDVFVAETRIPQIAPSEKRDATLNWTAMPGQHTLTAVVDPYTDSVDIDRADNAVSASVNVESAAISGLTGGAKVPAPGLGLLVLVAVVLAIARGRRPSG